MAVLSRRASRDTALVELQRLHAAILASKARRGALPGPAASAASSPDAPSPEADAARELSRRLQADPLADVGVQAETARSRKVWWVLAAAAVLVAGAWLTVTVLRQPEAVADADPLPPGPAARPAPGAGEAGPVVAAPPAASVVPARAVRVGLSTIRPVWIRVRVDGTRAIEREVAAGERLTFEGDQHVVVRVGDAGGVSATFNGEDRGPLGRNGLPLTVAFPSAPPAAAPAPAPAAEPAVDPTTRPPG